MMNSLQEEETIKKFVQINENGLFSINGEPVLNKDQGLIWQNSLTLDDRGRLIAKIDDEPTLVEVYDEPFIAQSITKLSDSDRWLIQLPYEATAEFDPTKVTLDEWDRFHGETLSGHIPFVMNRQAQDQFFNAVDEFDDESITIKGQRHQVHPWLAVNESISSSVFWSEIYQNEQPRWDLHAPSPALTDFVPSLKLQKSKVLVLGSGPGNDAAWFAENGHIVTAVDFSDEAIQLSRSRYGHLPNIEFVKSDIFTLPKEFENKFDLVFEHTCYCAIEPSRRTELMNVWRRSLVNQGHLMAVFFVHHKPFGPPYGGSEWEVRRRLNKSFRPLYWTRMKNSIPSRLGTELFVYAQKINQF